MARGLQGTKITWGRGLSSSHPLEVFPPRATRSSYVQHEIQCEMG